MEAQDDYFVNIFTPLYKTLPMKNLMVRLNIFLNEVKILRKLIFFKIVVNKKSD